MTDQRFKEVTVDGTKIVFTNWRHKELLYNIAGLFCLLALLHYMVSLERRSNSEIPAITRFLFLAFNFVYLLDIVVNIFTYTVNFKNRVVFDNELKEIQRQNLLGIRTMTFTEAGAIHRIAPSPKRSYYTVTGRNNRFGNGWHLTGVIKNTSALNRYLSERIIPLLNVALFENPRGHRLPGSSGISVDGENSQYYRHNDSIHVLDVPRSRFRPLLFLFILSFLLYSIHPLASAAFIGFWCIYRILTATRVIIAMEEKEIRLTNRFGNKNTRIIPFENVVRIAGKYRPSLLHPMEIHVIYKIGITTEEEFFLASSCSGKKLTAIANETEALLFTAK